MATKTIVLQISSSYEVPEIYKKGISAATISAATISAATISAATTSAASISADTIEDIEEALTMGAWVQSTMKSKKSTEEVRKVTERKDAELSRIHKQYQEKMEKLMDDMKVLAAEKEALHMGLMGRIKEARSAERESCAQQAEETLRQLRREHETLTSRYDLLDSRRRDLEMSREKDIHDAVSRTEQIMEKLVSSKTEQLTKMESAYQKLHDVIAKQSDDLVKLSASLGKRGANVKQKGSDYEEEFGEKLKRHYGLCKGFELKDTRLGMGHEMDFSMMIEDHLILWELKNYTSVVPKPEVDKFLRDLKENDATIGVMISRTTNIYGKHASGSMTTECEGGKLMIYLNRMEELCGEDESRIFQSLMAIFRIWWNYYREEDRGWDRMEMVRELEKAVEEMSKRRTEWRRHKAHLDEITRWTVDLLEETELRMDRLLKRASAQGNSVTIQDPHVPFTIPEGLFRDTREEKDLVWIQSILRVCSIGGEMEVRELVELLSATHKLSKDTIRSNIMAIIQDSAIVKKGIVKFVRGLSKGVTL